MTTTVSRSVVGEFDAIVLANRYVRAVIIPALGGRVWELEDRLRGRQWIWHREAVPLKAWPAGSDYDTVWAGGWEELFPNDAPCVFEGRKLPDHGEWWTLPWSVAESSGGRIGRVRLETMTSVARAFCSKEFRLASDAKTLTVTYRIQSREDRTFHFLFKQHLAVHLTSGCRLALPGGRIQAVEPSFGSILPGPGPFDWPQAREGDDAVDLRVVPPPSSNSREFMYVTDLPEPWCGVQDSRLDASIRVHFESSKLPFVWLFLSYGGWRDLYVAVLEPCSNLPKDLSEAVRSGRSARLAPRQEFTTKVSVALDCGSVVPR